MKPSAILLAATLFSFSAVLAQEDLAYMPTSAPARTADDETIQLWETEEPGIVRFSLPLGTHRVDLINAQGKVVEQLSSSDVEAFDLARLRPATWTLRAHTAQGFRVRRFVVHHGERANWVVEAAPRSRR